MRAEIFYQTRMEGALPLVLLGKDDMHELTNPYDRNCLASQQFQGRYGDVGIVGDEKGNTVKIYIGAGEGAEAQAVAHALNRLPAGHYFFEQPLSLSSQVMWSLGQYYFDRYKRKERAPKILSVAAHDFAEILAQADAIFLIRDLINTPANDMGPAELAAVVSQLAKTHGAEFKQWVGEELLHHNFPAIHAVGRAAAAEPRLLSLIWGNPEHPKVTLVGKGVCFDTGGLDIKPCNFMRLMKKDMGGAAQVIGLAQWIMAKRLPIRLHVLIPAVENAVSGNAYRPGDILTMRNGLRVEIDNTDAEGRLVLADALVKACEEKPELIIDYSTLTGAARTAVGTEISAMFSNDDAMAQALCEAANETNDYIWRMPLHSGYKDLLESSIADLVNCSGSPYAGAITAALFLQYFISDNIPWVHFDIMAWNVGNKPGKPEGGEAMGVQAVGQYLFRRYG